MPTDPTADIPDSVLAMVHRAVARLDDALQRLRRALDDSRIVAGRGVGTVCRESFVERRRRSGVTAQAIREDRAKLAEFVAVAAENGVDGAAVVRRAWQALKAERRANPSGRYFDRRRVERERRAAREAALAPMPWIGFGLRDRRHGYDVRHRGIVPDPYTLTPAEHRRRLARILREKHATKVEAWKREQARERLRESLRARGKQTPERVELAKRIRRARSGVRFGLRGGATPASIRRHYLEAKRRRREPVAKTAERLAELAGDRPWFVGAEAEGGTIVMLVSDLRAARKAVGERTELDGKRIELRKAARRGVA
jgi:hypothetical protein